MNALLEASFQWPALPATLMLVLVIAYWLLVIFGTLGVELFDFDLDADVDFSSDSVFDSVMSGGAVTLKFLNIGKMPISIWASAFTISFWTISMAWDASEFSEEYYYPWLFVLRNFAVALVATKIITQPLRGRFELKQPVSSDELIGSVGEVITEEVSQKLGQAEFKSEYSPLVLNVRSSHGVIEKGEQVTIVDYIADEKTYLVERTSKK